MEEGNGKGTKETNRIRDPGVKEGKDKGLDAEKREKGWVEEWTGKGNKRGKEKTRPRSKRS